MGEKMKDDINQIWRKRIAIVNFVLLLLLGFVLGLLFRSNTTSTVPFHKFPTSQCSAPLPQVRVLPVLLSKIYNGTSPYSHFPPPHLSPLLRPRRVLGWGSNNPVFETLIASVRPKTIIEVGTFLGASALHMAKITRILGMEDTLILCLDDFRGWPEFRDSNNGVFKDIADVNGDVVLMQQFMTNVVDAKEEERVLPMPFATAAGLWALCAWGVYGDLVEVDAGHDFHSAWMDVNMGWGVLRKGGVMFGHDYNLNIDDYGVRRAVDLFAREKGLTVECNGEHWVLHPPKQW